jgi:hypothetical protein
VLFHSGLDQTVLFACNQFRQDFFFEAVWFAQFGVIIGCPDDVFLGGLVLKQNLKESAFMVQKFLLQQVNSCNAEHPPPSLQFVDGTIITHLSGFVNVLQESRPSMPAFCRFLLKPKSHSVQRCNRAACIGTVQFKGLGVPNKYFAKQNKQMYIRLHCLQQL